MPNRNSTWLTSALIVLCLVSTPAAALELAMPLACTPGSDCFIQQYVDRDAGPGVRDYACGAETYDGHKGTDIRLRSTADVDKPVNVLAAAPGVVVGTRDGVPDHLVRNAQDQALVKNIECGNGVRIDHGGGWSTQYCHMRQGSVAVHRGDHVETGAKLGEVGYSGDAAFPHLHIQVEHDGEVVDPFLADDAKACSKDGSGPSLWSEAARVALSYRQGAILQAGFADHAPQLAELETGTLVGVPSASTPLVAYLWAINLQEGDVVSLDLGMSGESLSSNSQTVDHSKAQYFLFAGKKSPPGGWPSGIYSAEAKIMRDGKPALSQSETIEIK